MLRSRLAWIVACALSLALLGPVSYAGAQDAPVLGRIIKSGKLRVGMSGEQPPFNVQSKRGTLIGMEVDLATLLARSMEVDLVIVRRPFGELLDALAAGEMDMVMSGVTITPERNFRFAFVGPYFISGKSILTKSAELAEAATPAALNREDLSLAVLAGSTSELFAAAGAPKAKRLATPNYDEAVQHVLDGKADAMVADFPICVLSLFRHPNAGLRIQTRPLTLEPIGIALPPGDPLLVNMVENYLKTVDGAGIVDELRNRWFKERGWVEQLP